MNTSKLAHEKIKPVVHSIRERIHYAIVKSHPDGLTCEELEIQLGLKHQTCSARIRELRDFGSVIVAVDKFGHTRGRPTASGCTAQVYVAADPIGAY